VDSEDSRIYACPLVNVELAFVLVFANGKNSAEARLHPRLRGSAALHGYCLRSIVDISKILFNNSHNFYINFK